MNDGEVVLLRVLLLRPGAQLPRRQKIFASLCARGSAPCRRPIHQKKLGW